MAWKLKRRPNAVLSACLFALVIANWFNEVLRFSSPALNAAVLLGSAVLLGVSLLTRASALGPPRPFQFVSIGIPVCLTFPVIFVAAIHLVVLVHRGGVDSSFELVEAVPVGVGRVSAYRTNCGATCSFGIAIRHERVVVPGLLLVRRLGGFYPAYTATTEVLDGSTVRVAVPPYGRQAEAQSQVFRLLPNVRF